MGQILIWLLVGYGGMAGVFIFSNLPEIWRGTCDFTTLLPYLREATPVVLAFAAAAYMNDKERVFDEESSPAQ